MRIRSVLGVGFFLALTLGALCGCGSSSEQCLCPPPGSSELVGRYDLAGWAANASPLTVLAAWGSAEFDGVEGLRIQTVLNDKGVIDDSNPTSDVRYDVGLDRTLVVRGVGFPGINFLSGGLSTDGSLAITASAGAAGPSVFLFARRSGTWSDADLDGTYHLCGYTYEQGPQVHVGWIGVLTFDGAGGGTLSGATNRNGVTSVYGPSGMTYSVAADGAVTMGLGPGGVVQGTITKGGDVIVVSGSTTPGRYPALHVLVPTSTSASNAIFDGFYHVVGFEYDVASGDHGSAFGSAFADDTGMQWGYYQQKEFGLDQLSLSAVHTVAANGQFVVPASQGTDNLLGAVSPTGDVAVLGRVSDPLANPTVYILIR